MSTIDAFITAIEAGAGIPAACYADDAVLDATVPNWRFTVRGAQAISDQYGGWFAHPARLEELDRHPTAEGEVINYLVTWEEGGVPHAAHHCHVLTVGPDGRIVRDQVWCGGRWSADLLAEMGASAHAG